MRRSLSVSLVTMILLVGCADLEEPLSPPESPGESASALKEMRWGQGGLNADEQLARVAEALPGFGGLYLDQGRPVVYLTDLDRADQARSMLGPLIDSLLAMGRDPGAPLERPEVRFEQARHDWGRLFGWRRGINDVLALPDVVLTDIDERNNVIRIGVSSDAPREGIRRLALAAGVPEDAYVIERTKPIEYHNGSLQDRWWPPVAGLQIQSSEGALCTLGYNANHFVLGRGFITASHCTKVQGGTEGTKFHQSYKSFYNINLVGTEAHDPQYYSWADCPIGRACRHSDSAFVQYGPLTAGRLGKLAMPLSSCQNPETSCSPEIIQQENLLYQVVNDGFTSALAVGQVLDKIGRSSGQTYGPVTHTCIDSNVNGTNITQICQYVVGAGSTGGDSGGPVFMRHGTTGNVDAIGILWGGSGGADFVFSLLWDVQNETGGAGAITLR